MDVTQLKDNLISKARELGIDKIGFASADPFIELREKLKVQQDLDYASGFEEKDLERRTNPDLLLPQAKTIIAIAIAYPSKLKNPPKSVPGDFRGVFCRASWGMDYHHVLRDKLSDLAKYLQSIFPNCRTKIMVDTGELSDRAVAERAGIGWSAKNTSIITKEFGSYVYLGELITDIYIPSDQPITDECGDCTLCLDACPTGALINPGQLNAKTCIAYLTQTKEMVPEPYRKKIGNRLYGCDTCQAVCPKNRKVHFDHQEAFYPDGEKVKPLLKPFLKMSNKDFKIKFGSMAGSWRGKKPIQRNAIMALAHFKDETAVPQLCDLLKNDPRSVIRGTAAWALGEIGGKEALGALHVSIVAEQEEEVIVEIENALQRFN